MRSNPLRSGGNPERGAALLAVLWLVAALSAIAFTVASTVRAETDRVSTQKDALGAHYLASGAIYRSILWLVWGGNGYRSPDGRPLYFHSPMPRIHYEFPSGVVDVEVIPEKSKLDINHAPGEELLKLLLALGTPADRAQTIAQAIVDWRTPSAADGLSPMDAYYLSLTPSFRARHASFEEIEELLLVQGMTPEIFYGGFTPGPDGALIPYGGLRDCVSVYGSVSEFDVNTVQPAILSMLGVSGDSIRQLLQMRAAQPILSVDKIGSLLGGTRANGKLIIGGGTITTLRATARLRYPDGRLSDMKRTVSAMVKILSNQWDPPYHILRWYDTATSASEVTYQAPEIPKQELSGE
jgi:general secretion pathway protein K